MLQIKEFRERYGLSQRELALLLGASLQQVKRSEATGAWPNGKLSDLYRHQKTLFYTQAELPATANDPEPAQPENFLLDLEELKKDCQFLIRKHERNLAQFLVQYGQAKLFYAVLIQFLESLTDADEDHLGSLQFLESLLLRKLGRTGPVQQLKISIRIKILQKQIESADDILNGKL